MAMVCWVQNTITETPTLLIWPSWHNTICITSFGTNTFVTNQTSATTTSIYGNTIYWPVWHEDIFIPVMPAIIQEEWTEAEKIQLRARKREQAELIEKRKIADLRSKEIFLEHLSPEQRDMVEKNGWFVIEGGKSGKLYRISSGVVAGNIEELDAKGEKTIAKYCCHLRHDFPKHDHHLTQKLMLEWDEEEFLKKANKTAVG